MPKVKKEISFWRVEFQEGTINQHCLDCFTEATQFCKNKIGSNEKWIMVQFYRLTGPTSKNVFVQMCQLKYASRIFETECSKK